MLVLIKHRLEKRGFWVKSDVNYSYIGSIRVSVVTLVIPEKLPRRAVIRQVDRILEALRDDGGLLCCLSRQLIASGLCSVLLKTPELSVITAAKAGELAILSPSKKNCMLLSSGAFGKNERHALDVLISRFRYFELDLPQDCFFAAQEILNDHGITARSFDGITSADVALIFHGSRVEVLPPTCTVINISKNKIESSLSSYVLHFPDYFKTLVTEDFRIDEIIAYAIDADIIKEGQIRVSDAKFCNKFKQNSVLHLDNAL